MGRVRSYHNYGKGRRYSRVNTPKAGPVTITRADGTVEVQPALTLAQRQALAKHELPVPGKRRSTTAGF